MKPKTEIIGNRVVNSVEQLASLLHPGDIFRMVQHRTPYRFEELIELEKVALCENLETHQKEKIYFHSPVFKLIFL